MKSTKSGWSITLAITGQPDGDSADGPRGAVA
jgi:hypothetical protein